MKFMKTIAAVAFTATSAFALVAPSDTKTICLNAWEDANGVLHAGNCDESRNNETLNKELLANGCAEDQISLISREVANAKYDIEIRNCLPPNVVQL